MVIKVLISGAGGDVGQGVLKALAASKLDIDLYATCISAHSSWLHAVGINSFIAPPSADSGYVDYLIRLIRRFGIQVYFPTVDSEIVKISRERARIEAETGVLVFVDDPERVAICDDKYETAEYLRRKGFAYPATVVASEPYALEFVSRLGYPVIVKRRRDKGSQHVYQAHDATQLAMHLGDTDFVVQEFLDPAAGEFTSGLYLGDDGQIKGVCTFRRQLKGGSTFIAERIIAPVLEAPLEDMARALGMKYLNVQSMLRGNELVPFEFNGRLSGSTAMVAKLFNAPEMFIRERLLGEKLIRVEDPTRFVAMRYYEEVYTEPERIDALITRSAEI
jgi:carbamoyl-phosphate synthase large subunit